MVIANHMLYHVENIDRAMIEVNEVLKKQGIFLRLYSRQRTYMKERNERALFPKVYKVYFHLESFTL